MSKIEILKICCIKTNNYKKKKKYIKNLYAVYIILKKFSHRESLYSYTIFLELILHIPTNGKFKDLIVVQKF